jgi:tetratricopeptide (TPR) repeat protein
MLPLVLAFVAADLYDLSGGIAPPERAAVSIHGVASPFTNSTITEDDGRFTFKKLEAGAYTVSVFIPARGEARQTIEVGPGTADEKRRVAVTLRLKESDFVFNDVMRRRHSVGAKQLAIPEKATREYEEAQKDLARRDTEAAVAHLQKAVDIAPQFATAWNNLGTIAYQTQKYERAEACFRSALEADPTAFEPLVNLGGVLVNLHKLDEAWKYNVAAVLARPNDPLANSQLGMTYFEIGSLPLAEKHFRKALEVDAGHFSHPQLFLAEIHLRRGDRKAAAADLEGFLKHHPDWPYAATMREKIAEWTALR